MTDEVKAANLMDVMRDHVHAADGNVDPRVRYVLAILEELQQLVPGLRFTMTGIDRDSWPADLPAATWKQIVPLLQCLPSREDAERRSPRPLGRMSR